MTLPTMMKAMLERFGTAASGAGRAWLYPSKGWRCQPYIRPSTRTGGGRDGRVPCALGNVAPWSPLDRRDRLRGWGVQLRGPLRRKEARIDADTLWWAWRLNPLWRRVLSMPAFTAFVMHDVAPKPALVASLRPQAESPPSNDSLEAAAPGP